jgi:hypothetical protein
MLDSVSRPKMHLHLVRMVSKHSAKLHSGELGVLAGYEAIHMIRKGQARWSAAGAKVGLLHRFILGLFAATS